MKTEIHDVRDCLPLGRSLIVAQTFTSSAVLPQLDVRSMINSDLEALVKISKFGRTVVAIEQVVCAE